MSGIAMAHIVDIDQHRSPQLEDGHVRIANELYDALLSFGFTGRQIHVLFAIVRKTYGYGKKEDDISASQIGQACKLNRTHVTATLNQLATMRVIHKAPGVYGSVVGINKNYSQWESSSTESVQVYQNSPSTILVHPVPKSQSTSTESVQVDRTKSVHTKDNLPINNKQKKSSCANADAFSRFWSVYPKKKSKGQAEKAFAKLHPDEQLMQTVLSAIERAKKSDDWVKSKGQFIPHPATWLNAKGWEDELLDTASSEKTEWEGAL